MKTIGLTKPQSNKPTANMPTPKEKPKENPKD